MDILNFNGKNIKQLVVDNENLIYTTLLNKIKKVYKNASIKYISIITIKINDEFNHEIKIERPNYISSLKKAIIAFEKSEEYEKCGECIEIIKYLKSD